MDTRLIMNYIAYLFELKSIQSYLMAGGKLKDMVNASDMLEQITEGSAHEPGWLDSALELANLTLNNDASKGALVNLSRRAGGAVYLIAEASEKEKLEKFRLLWSLTVQQILPDCEFVDCLTSEGLNAFDCVAKGRVQLLEQRSLFYPSLPLSTPMTQIAPRTGTPATGKKDKEWLDKSGLQKRQYRSAKSNLASKFSQLDAMAWPSSLEHSDFPYISEEKDIAIIHIDGNGLGQILMDLAASVETAPDGYIKFYSTFSNKLKEATEAAAQEATEKVLIADCIERGEKIIAARPLVLGGDDLTIIIRADLSLSFSRIFIESFEKHSGGIKKALKALKKDYKSSPRLFEQLPDRLTACGGIVFQKASQPFMMGFTLAESLCQFSKATSKAISVSKIPSSLTFYQIQSSVIDDYSTIKEQELTSRDKRFLTLGSYSLGEYQADTMPALGALQDSVHLLSQPQQSGVIAKLRQWSGHLLLDTNAADVYEEQLDKSLRLQDKSYHQLKESMKQLMKYDKPLQHSEALPWFDKQNNSPLVDLITLTNLEIK